jgi:hypothetical protein
MRAGVPSLLGLLVILIADGCGSSGKQVVNGGLTPHLKAVTVGDGEVISGPGEVVTGHSEVITGPGEVMTGPGEVGRGQGDVAAGPRPNPGDSVTLAAAKNEWTSFALEVGNLKSDSGLSLRLGALHLEGNAAATIAASNFETYQVLPMPVDVNRAGYVRHTGSACCSAGQLPRALLPTGNGAGTINLASLRDATHPTDPTAHPAANVPVHLWVDLHVPTEVRAGDYVAACDIIPTAGPSDKPGQPRPPLASIPLHLTVYDFALPDERHLQMVSQVSWDSLTRYYPQDFETVTPRLINRESHRYAGTVKTLDALVAEAQRNRLSVFFPRLQPTVKWPAFVQNPAPDVDWVDFDTLVTPWLQGGCFADKMALGYWPLPEPDFLRNYDVESRLRYWSLATTHFDQNDWLSKTAVVLEKQTPGRVGAGDSLELSAEAAGLLRSHARLRVTVPMEDEQIELVDPKNPANAQMVDPADTSRLLCAAPSLVFNPPDQSWSDDVKRPAHWLRSDLPGLVPYVGAGGDEHDVRVWAWLAFLRRASLVSWGSALPSWKDGDDPAQDASRAADPNELIWFYPGSWFGTDQPVPTIQLKWLRRAQQDYEYLWLAQQRGETIEAMQMARLITKPVEIPRNQVPDPTYSLMSGTTDNDAWSAAQRLLAETILLHPPGAPDDKEKQEKLYVKTLLWQTPQERPLLIGRTAQWTVEPVGGKDAQPGTWLRLETGLDIYNAADVRKVANLLQWSVLPAGWEVHPQPVEVPRLATYQVVRASLQSRVNLDKVTAESRKPLELQFVDGFTNTSYPLKLMLPVATCERLEGPFVHDGKLDSWAAADAIQNGPMVRMLDRPSLQKQELQLASTSTQLYTGWAEDKFYVAFGVGGISSGDLRGGQNFVDYQARRAWGEDLCEVLVQPVYVDNTLGPVFQVVCKPNGSNWVERKLDPHLNADPWVPFLSTGIRYVAALQPGTDKWSGELAIPWRILSDPGLGAPTMLRFNFCQHRHATGESASWAGPVDFGRDDDFMGAIYLRRPNEPGMVDILRPSKPNPSGPTHIEQ